MSVVSIGAGGANFDSVANGSKCDYCFNLTPLEHGASFRSHVQQLFESVQANIHTIELQSGKKIDRFVIGKTACPARAGVVMDRVQVMNAFNWKGSAGPGKRWQKTYLTDNFQGLVVICGVTHDLRPLDMHGRPIVHQTQYALALEQSLTHEFVLNQKDSRCSNKSFSSGGTGTEENGAIGVVYFAFRLTENVDDDDREVNEVVNFVNDSDMVNQFLKRVKLGDELPTSEKYTNAVDKYDSIADEEQARVLELIREGDEATSDDEADVQELSCFAIHLSDFERKALLLHAQYGSDDAGDIGTALDNYYALTSDQQEKVIRRLK